MDELQAILLLTKHLNVLLPFLLALKRVPGTMPQRVGLLQEIARKIAEDGDLAQDWYKALGLLSGKDLSNQSVADLMRLSVTVLGDTERLGDVWGAAYEIGLIDEEMLKEWMLFQGIRS